MCISFLVVLLDDDFARRTQADDARCKQCKRTDHNESDDYSIVPKVGHTCSSSAATLTGVVTVCRATGIRTRLAHADTEAEARAKRHC